MEWEKNEKQTDLNFKFSNLSVKFSYSQKPTPKRTENELKKGRKFLTSNNERPFQFYLRNILVLGLLWEPTLFNWKSILPSLPLPLLREVFLENFPDPCYTILILRFLKIFLRYYDFSNNNLDRQGNLDFGSPSRNIVMKQTCRTCQSE